MSTCKDFEETGIQAKSNLPNVEAPNRAESTNRTDDNKAMPAYPPAATASAPSRAHRIALFAALIALGAALGVTASALGAAGLMRPVVEMADAAFGMVNESPVLHRVVTQLQTNLAAFKAGVEAGIKRTNEQVTAAEARVDHAPAEPAAVIIRDIQSAAVFTQENLGQLENRVYAVDGQEITGSVPSQQRAVARPATAQPAVAKTSVRPQRPVVNGWIVRNVYSGTVLVEGRGFGMIEVAPGETIPGVGRVEAIRKQNGRWVVVTARGLIVSAR